MGSPELLAPAGTWEALRAAVANGADAVYFGVEAFNARMRAANFRRAELPELMAWLHQRGVKGFLTVNVLVFSQELEEAAELVLAAAAAGVDALIVQDIGLARLARGLAPDLAIHGSTQMSITSAAGVAQAATLGCERVVLARELTLADLTRLQKQLAERQLAMPLEVFVHGALCVAYSGQCLTSEALGQRSANRGECAQACRLPYQLIVDGEERDLHDQRYLLSPQDLAAWERLPELSAIGIASLKIEGRLKDATYVAAVTDAYRQSLDRLAEGQAPGALGSEQRRSLELSFSRGLSIGWLDGIDHRALVHARWSKKRGPRIGVLEQMDPQGWWTLRSREALKPGDGVVFEAPGSDPLEAPHEVGGRVMAVQQRSGNRLAIRLGPGRIDGRGLRPGSPCWLTSDPSLERQGQPLANRPVPERCRALDLTVGGRVGQPLQLEVLAAEGLHPDCLSALRISSAVPLQAATGQPLDASRLEAQLGRLGGTGWYLADLQLALEGDLFLPLAQLNRLRRDLVDGLAQLEPALGAWLAPEPPVPATDVPTLLQQLSLPPTPEQRSGAGPQDAQLIVLARSLDQLRALRDQPVAAVIADLDQPSELREAVAIGRGCWPGGIWLAGPRITRPDERWTLEPLLRAQPDGYLVRNADQLEVCTPLAPCCGDFSLNVANPLTAAWFLEHWALQRITASYDLDLQQLLALVRGCPADRVEVTVHQHMPLFHMEHCLFCAFLSDGHDHTDCGRPCEQHTVLLRDRSGSDHPLRADLGCRNTLFNGRAQTAAEALPQLIRAGVRHFRVELLQEQAAETRHRVQQYAAALRGEISGRSLWQREQLDSRLGVTRGSLRGGRGVG
jgi:putative protease